MNVAIAQLRRRVGRTLDAMAAPRNSRRFVERVLAARPDARVAFGVGHRPLDGWINTDVTRAAGCFLDVTKPWPTPPGSVARIYAEHVIEHFPLEVARQVFRNCARALQPGGRVRFVTPDLERAARAYLEGSEVGRQHLAHFAAEGRVAEHSVDLIRQLFSYDNHWKGYLYDFASLSEELQAAGFVDVVRMDPGQSEDACFRGLESRTDGSFFHFQLVVEAQAPGLSEGAAR